MSREKETLPMARTFPAISLAAAMLLGSAGSLGTAEDVLRMVPRKALGFVVIHGLGDTDAKIQKLVPQSRIPSSSPLFLVKALLGISKGLDEKRSVVLIAMPPEKPDAEPAVVLLMPVTDYRQFLEPLHPVTPEEKVTEVKMNGKAALAAKRGHYADPRRGGAPQGASDRAGFQAQASTPSWPIFSPGWRKTMPPPWPPRRASSCFAQG